MYENFTDFGHVPVIFQLRGKLLIHQVQIPKVLDFKERTTSNSVPVQNI